MKSLIDIANTLNCNYDLYSCCTSNRINQWSFGKPVNHESYGVLTTEQYYDVNDGFLLFVYDDPRQMMYNILHNNNLWKYEDRMPPYRLTDFEDYNHGGDLNFNVYFVNDNSGSPDSNIKLECNYEITDFLKWKYFDGYDNLDLCCVFYEPDTDYTQSGMTGIYVEKIIAVEDYDGSISFKIPPLTNGQYEARLCFTDTMGNRAQGDIVYETYDNRLLGNWFCFPPDSYFVFNINSGGGGGGGGGTTDDYFDYVTFTYDNVYFEYYSPTIYDFSFVINLQCDEHVPINVYAEIYYTNVIGNPINIRTFNSQLSYTGERDSIYCSAKDSIDAANTAQLDNGIISVYIKARISYVGRVQEKTWTQRLEIS